MIELYNLIYHLKKCPEDFLTGTLKNHLHVPEVGILIKDCYRKIYGDFNISDSLIPAVTDLSAQDENRLISLQIACWFFSHTYFIKKPQLLPKIHEFIFEDLMLVCEYVKYREWVEDEDRVEEFVRLALKRCELLPDGEQAEQFSDRLDALDTLKRQKVLSDTRESLERIKEIKRKMAEQKAREAANVYGRE